MFCCRLKLTNRALLNNLKKKNNSNYMVNLYMVKTFRNTTFELLSGKKISKADFKICSHLRKLMDHRETKTLFIFMR